jgi:hypothetical protein
MMKEQFTAILGVLTRPKKTMQQLPSNRIYALALLAPLYFGIARAFRPRYHAILYEKLGGNLKIVLFVLVTLAIMIPLGAWIMRQILKLFRKRLSVRKIMNISGYSYVPRLIVAVIGYILLFLNPSMFAENRPTPSLVILIVLGFAGMIYNLFLLIYGFVFCPSEEKTETNNTFQATSETAPNAAPDAPEG